jgi:acetylglutamate kinase
MKNELSIIKIGGKIIENDQLLNSFLKNFARLKGPKILIHGGGKQATELGQKLGHETKMNEGRRITSTENLEVITMVYAGLINKNIIAKLQASGCNSIGLTGADANCISAKKRPVVPIDFGWVGDVESVNTDMIQLLLSKNITPVFCAISHDGNGQLLNTNADTVGAEIAIAMSENYETELIYCFEKDGVLMDVNDELSIIENITSSSYQKLKLAGVIHAGMLPKIENAFHALAHNVSKVVIGNANSIIENDKKHTQITI